MCTSGFGRPIYARIDRNSGVVHEYERHYAQFPLVIPENDRETASGVALPLGRCAIYCGKGIKDKVNGVNQPLFAYELDFS
ncbi:hypothetical protein RB195_004712 [Necator americanus]|uniref:Uncharacterized protein n=1 Tax=Necator americanus TaxID=51031 RepID=A0ABR1BMN7_NECAM